MPTPTQTQGRRDSTMGPGRDEGAGNLQPTSRSRKRVKI
jgi:hypothetical protein